MFVNETNMEIKNEVSVESLSQCWTTPALLAKAIKHGRHRAPERSSQDLGAPRAQETLMLYLSTILLVPMSNATHHRSTNLLLTAKDFTTQSICSCTSRSYLELHSDGRPNSFRYDF
ncbi:hypothetical protein KC19_5G112400 [Ceratodon purpureus]|uniref:Uncharacterized protein n=1 Tax=Ceratodon purpureus TaxID=3225 RepID=A0A8T0I095_CERPU|nr:hypothetical protein KC19_5G112400 [Ceratodon purpureus]